MDTPAISRDDKELEVERVRREQLEKALQESEERYRTILSTVSDYIFTVRVDRGRAVQTTHGAACVAVTGYTAREFATDLFLWYKMVVEADRAAIEHHASELLANHNPGPLPHRIRRKDGAIRWVTNTPVLHRDGAGNLVAYDGLVRDITERKTAEDALRERERFISAVTDAAPNAIYVYDLEARQNVFANRSIIDRLGYSQAEMEEFSRKGALPLHPEDEPRFVDHLQRIVAEATDADVLTLEYRLLRKDGSYAWFLSQDKVFNRDSAGKPTHVLGVAADITERKSSEEQRRRMEEQLSQAHKLESLGILAGGIAHDFNNMLAGLFGNISLARQNVRGETAEILDQALSVFERARSLTQQLLTFAKGGQPLKKTVKLGPLLKDSVRFVLSGSNVNVTFRVADDLWPCDIDENQICQAIDNIALNARQAMPEGGTITVTARNVDTSDHLPAPLEPGSYVRITIQDHGPGIAKEHLSRIFDPFFTTKQHGSGLGLTTAYSILRKHGGHIESVSAVGKGAAFHVYLPASISSEAFVGKPDRAGSRVGQGRILLMDDELYIQRAISRMLRAMGYDVECVKDGKEAIRVYEEERAASHPFDLVLLDLTVPGGMGGKDAIGRMLEADPDVRAVVLSGYSNDPVMSEPVKFGFCGCLAKPFTFEEMVDLLQRVLGKPSGQPR